MISDEDLDLLDADTLLDALGRRYEAWAFVAARDKVKTVDDGQIVSMRTSHDGDRLRVIGLCHYLADALSRELREDFAESEDEP